MQGWEGVRTAMQPQAPARAAQSGGVGAHAHTRRLEGTTCSSFNAKSLYKHSSFSFNASRVRRA